LRRISRINIFNSYPNRLGFIIDKALEFMPSPSVNERHDAIPWL